MQEKIDGILWRDCHVSFCEIWGNSRLDYVDCENGIIWNPLKFIRYGKSIHSGNIFLPEIEVPQEYIVFCEYPVKKG